MLKDGMESINIKVHAIEQSRVENLAAAISQWLDGEGRNTIIHDIRCMNSGENIGAIIIYREVKENADTGYVSVQKDTIREQP